MREKFKVYIGFMDLEKPYDRVNRKHYHIKSMYINSLACVRVKGGESEAFRMESGVRQAFIMSP